jgi:hypothetical protein
MALAQLTACIQPSEMAGGRELWTLAVAWARTCRIADKRIPRVAERQQVDIESLNCVLGTVFDGFNVGDALRLRRDRPGAEG